MKLRWWHIHKWQPAVELYDDDRLESDVRIMILLRRCACGKEVAISGSPVKVVREV